jgi:hypothetical protein
MAVVSFLIGAVGSLASSLRRVSIAVAVAMVLFFHAARVAMVAFDPFLSSRQLVETLDHSPQGRLIVDHHYYWYSSVFFYTNRRALLLNGRFFNLVYGSYAPGAPNVFIDDPQFKQLWQKPERYYVFTKGDGVARLRALVGRDQLTAIGVSGGKILFTNHPIGSTGSANGP